MSVEVFDSRIQPSRTLGVPDAIFFYGVTGGILCVFAFVIPVLLLKFVTGFMGFVAVYQAWLAYISIDDLLIQNAKDNSKRRKKMVSFGALNKKTYSDGYTWKTSIGDNVIAHDGRVVSVAFVWDGVHNRFSEKAVLRNEHNRRAAMLKTLPTKIGLCVENHLCRFKDDSLCDAYMKKGEELYRGKKRKYPIIMDVRKQIADTYRPLARTNRVITVFSLGAKENQSILQKLTSWLKIKTFKDFSDWESLSKEALNLVTRFANEYPGLRLLTYDQYQQEIQKTQNPYNDCHSIDWRFNLSEQLINVKPVHENGLLKAHGLYFKSCLLQNYPGVSFEWVFQFCEAAIDFHAVQIIIPKNDEAAINKNKRNADHESKTTSEQFGLDKAIDKLKTSARYRTYVTDNKLAVADNAFIITFSDPDPSRVNHYMTGFKQTVAKENGLARDDDDLQDELFRIRLMGMGRSSLFLREDHADTIAAMSPMTTFPAGDPYPECLWITSSGTLYGSCPSKLSILSEIIAAEMGGGKDAYMSKKIMETHALIRYDVVELGNSYQGTIESIGGSYCRARDQVINPLSAYKEYQKIVKLNAESKRNLVSDFIVSQSNMLAPILKGLKSKGFTNAEMVIVNNIITLIYESPENKLIAPTLEHVLNAFDDVEISSERQKIAKELLQGELSEFLKTEIGKKFTEQDQFVISPIANAIDFDKINGDLFDYYLTFILIRLVTSAMSSGIRNQFVLNELKILMQRAPDAIRWVVLTLDAMGRKDLTGLTKISQGTVEMDFPESPVASAPNRTLLSRSEGHYDIGEQLTIPRPIVDQWANFGSPDQMDRKGYREALMCELGVWHKLHLKFPQLHLDLTNTRGEDKVIRDKSYEMESDPYKRIQIQRELILERAKERDNAEKQANTQTIETV